jgi:hypothetical protein
MLARIGRVDVHHARRRVAAINGALRPAQHLDRADVEHGQTQRHRGGIVDPVKLGGDGRIARKTVVAADAANGKAVLAELQRGTVETRRSALVMDWRSSAACETTLTAIGALEIFSLLFCAVTTISVVSWSFAAVAFCAKAGVAKGISAALASRMAEFFMASSRDHTCVFWRRVRRHSPDGCSNESLLLRNRLCICYNR